jgi:membrane-bound lytic murein transglycosylase A
MAVSSPPASFRSQLIRIFHEARCARREKCSETVCVGPIVPTQTVGSKFRRYASEFASASMHLLARTLHFRAIFGLVQGLLPALFIVSALLCSGCARLPATGPHDAFVEVAAPELSDDLELAGLIGAIQAQSGALHASSAAIMEVGPIKMSRGDYRTRLEQLSARLESSIPYREKLDFIRDNFRFFELRGGSVEGEILLTSYFEPVIAGSLVPTPTYSRPLYGKPKDLLTLALAAFSEKYKDDKPLKARLYNDRIVPFFNREEIDGKGALAHRGLELVWVDPVDAFFLQIQGSGTVVLPNKQELHIVYADKNGHRYEAIGKFLRERIAPQKVTMQRVEALLRSLPPQERDRIMFMNPSYVFFSRSQKRAVTSLGVPATPGRTIAADPRFAPKGALVFLEFEKPVFTENQSLEEDPAAFEPSARFVLDQDSGGAITGTGRVDLFWGRGDEAKRYAGVLQNRARALYLVPK